MPSVLSIALVAFQLGTSLAPAVPADAYLDEGARQLVERARNRRSAVEGRIERYTTVARSRISIGFHALRRDRSLYRCEAASRIQWVRGDTIRIDLLGAREAVPMFSREVRAGNHDCGEVFFDPTADRLAFALGGGMSLEDSSFLHHPLAEGSEQDYRFRSGETTTMRLPDGTVIRLLELEVLPRRSEPFLVRGSLWLEDRSYAVVRAVLRMARPFDYDRDARYFRDDDDNLDDDDDEVPRILRPIRGELRFITIEYGLWDQQWWLPRLIALEGEGEAAKLLKVPLRMERKYDSYDIVALPAGVAVPELPALPPDSVCGGGHDPAEESTEGDERRRRVEVSGEGEAPSRPGVVQVGCECVGDRCQVVVTRAAVDSMELVTSDLLPPSIFSAEDPIVTEGEMEELLSRVKDIASPPLALTPITWRIGLQGFDLVRYNRVEGLSLGAAANMEMGVASLDATVRLGLADLAPNFEVAATRRTALSRQRLAVYRRLDAVGPGEGMMGFGSSLAAFFLGRDDGDYYRSWGVELTREPSRTEDGLRWRLFGELQRPAEKQTDFNLPNAFGEQDFRPNFTAEEVEQVGAQLQLTGSLGADPTGWRAQAMASLLASTGSFSFAQPRLMLLGAAPLPFDLLGGLELNGGTTFGAAPVQSTYFLGGGRTVRGYEGSAAIGESFWTARAEIATSAPGARVVLFSDAGWAGDARDVELDPTLLSAGVGVSFLDGILRFDLARALREVRGNEGWRFEVQVDAGL